MRDQAASLCETLALLLFFGVALLGQVIWLVPGQTPFQVTLWVGIVLPLALGAAGAWLRRQR